MIPSCYDSSEGATYQKLPLAGQILGESLLSFLLSCPGLLVMLFLGLLLITGVLIWLCRWVEIGRAL